MTDDEQQVSQPQPSAEPGDVLPEASGPPPFKDRRAGLIVFGIVQIVMGGFSGLMIPFMLMSLRQSAAAGMPMDARMTTPVITLYGMLAVLLVWLGIGSILARRWARALTLVGAWGCLVFGAFMFVVMGLWMPGLFAQQLPPQARPFFLVTMFGILGLLYVGLPGAFVLFYRSPHVKATCEAADAHIRWTDRCPLPVLALSLLLAFGSLSMIATLSYGGVIPLFGMLMTGVPAIIASLAMGVLFAYLAWGAYKLKMSAWWTSLIAYATFMLSWVVTFSRIDMMEMYRAMNFPEEQLKAIEQSGVLKSMNMAITMGVTFVVIVGFLLWVRRNFVAGSDSQARS